MHRATWPSGIRRRVPGRAYRAASSSSVPAPLGSRTPPTGAVGITAAAPVTLRLRRAVAGDVQHADLVLGDLHRDVRRPGRLRSVHRKRSASAWPARPPRHVRWPRRPIPSTYRRVASRGTPGGMADESPAAVELLGPRLLGGAEPRPATGLGRARDGQEGDDGQGGTSECGVQRIPPRYRPDCCLVAPRRNCGAIGRPSCGRIATPSPGGALPERTRRPPGGTSPERTRPDPIRPVAGGFRVPNRRLSGHDLC